MSSGYRVDPSSSPHLDYGQGNDDSPGKNDGSASAASTNHKSYIDRSNSRKGEDKSLDMRKARKKNKRKKKKISERNTREFDDNQTNG
ncbi:hypothetical protein [Endozoicomonas sp. SCSIO W0465]|uniref:hypothetical protein n=1 Tax=Endozoicomonas sp. SCSIO W0465 TaxID=2918516 RepID=UPI0020751AF3|nr:hypothetical protein [Endozoicomonas sp. SCSIO W0465]USE36605.1 hypothetical protein MJO57_32125 [Endozoicomonas sp. SCSIO W0465]